MKKTLAVMLAAVAAVTATSAAAGDLEDVNARLELLERQNAAIRKENAALRESQRLLGENARLKSQGARAAIEPARTSARPHQENSAFLAVSAVSQQSKNPLQAYAADLPVKAPPLAGPGLFRAWIEGGAIWSGGDPISSTYGFTGQFDLTPKVGWEAAIGFDHRFAGSPWHISGQFRYGEGGKTTGLDSLTQILPALPPTSATSTETFGAAYKETRWLADLAVGRDIAGSGPSALQLKGGFRVAEFVTRNTNSDILATSASGINPPLVVPGFPPVTSFTTTATTLTDTRASFLGAGPLIGVEGSVPFAGKWSLDYAGDVALLFGRQQSASTTTTLFSVTPSYLAALAGVSNTLSTSSDRLFAGVLSADIQVGVSYWLTQNLKLGAGYRLDAFINVFNQSSSSNANLTPDRYTHGPRVTLTGQFDAM
jgi:opacity protein-like surface antigen